MFSRYHVFVFCFFPPLSMLKVIVDKKLWQHREMANDGKNITAHLGESVQLRKQGFRNSIKGWGESPQWEGNGKFCWERFFWWLSNGGNLKRSDFDYSNPFSKLKTTCCKYWTSIEIKINVACVYKEFEVKIKMVQEQWLS